MIFESGGRGREPFYVDDIFRLETNLDALSGGFFFVKEINLKKPKRCFKKSKYLYFC